jgi:hypothetical protein
MSLIVSVYTREGIVMAADSRLTLTYPRTIPGEAPHTFSVAASITPKNCSSLQTGLESQPAVSPQSMALLLVA